MTDSLSKLSCETPLEHHKRLILGKVIDKSLSDIDYSELSEVVYGQRYSSDTARRMMYGSAKTLQMMESEPDRPPVIEPGLVEVQKEKIRLADQRREYNKMITEMGRIEHIADRLVDAAQNLNETVCPLFDNSCVVDFEEDNEAVLVLCDWHYGMVTNNIWNMYDTEVCRKRVKNVVGRAA